MVRSFRSPVIVLATLALAACRGDLAAPTAPLGPPSVGPRLARAAAPEVVPGQYLVTFRDGVADGAAKAQSKAAEKIARAKKGRLKHTYSAVMHGFAAELDSADVAVLRADPDIALVEPDPVMRIAGSQSGATWGLDRIDQAALPLNGSYVYGNDGAGVTVYILDTGINTGHVDFGGRAVVGLDAVSSGGGAADCHGHGTHVAGTVGSNTWGVAKAARLVAVRVLDCTGNGGGSSLLAGMDYVVRQKQGSPATPMIVNMSISGSASATFDNAVQNMINAGVTAVVAAGNASSDACGVSPARLPSAITVGASDASDNAAAFSNHGSCVDLTAPGVNITSTYIGGSTALAGMSGTSMAAPHVAGAAALYLAANRSAAPAQVASALVGNSTTGRLSALIGGTPNRLLSIAFVGSAPSSPTEPAPPTTRTTGPLANAAASGLCLTSNGSGAVTALQGCGGTAAQSWSVPAGGAHGAIVATGNGQCLDAFGGSSSVGDGVGLWSCHGGSNQTFTLTAAGELRVANGLCVGPRGGSAASGAVLELQGCTGAAPQRWTAHAGTAPAPTPSLPTTRTTGPLVSVATGSLCLTANSAGAVSGLQGCTAGSTAQSWSVPGVGTAGAVGLVASGQCLDAFGGNSAPGDDVGTYGCHGGSNQSYTLTAAGELKVANGLCVAPRGGSAIGGATVELQSCTGSSAQRWSVGGTPAPAPTPAPTDPVTPGTRFTGQLANLATGLCVQANGTGAGAMTALASCTGGSTQRWSVPGQGSSGALVLTASGQCADAFGGSSNVGDGVGLWSCHGGSNQTFTLTAAGELRVPNGRCVGPRGGTAHSGAALELQACSGTSSQRWVGSAR
jgi:subtilisin family serine protease